MYKYDIFMKCWLIMQYEHMTLKIFQLRESRLQQKMYCRDVQCRKDVNS